MAYRGSPRRYLHPNFESGVPRHQKFAKLKIIVTYALLPRAKPQHTEHATQPTLRPSVFITILGTTLQYSAYAYCFWIGVGKRSNTFFYASCDGFQRKSTVSTESKPATCGPLLFCRVTGDGHESAQSQACMEDYAVPSFHVQDDRVLHPK